MATVGTNPGSWAGWDNAGTGFAFASSYTMPSPGGLITNLHAYFDATAGGQTGALCLWDGSGNLLASVTGIALNAGSSSPGGQTWHTAALGTPVFVASGATIWIGGQTGATLLFSSGVGGASNVKAMGSPGSFAGSSSSGIGVAGAYADYTPGGVFYVNTGTPASPVWSPAQTFVNTGTPASPVWTPTSGIFVNTGTPASPVWTPTS